MAALAVTGTVGVVSTVSVQPAHTRVQLAGFGVPLPADPPPPGPAAPEENVPTPDQVTSVLDRLTDPNVGYQGKLGLVENGLSPEEGQGLDQDLARFNGHGELPYNFAVSDIQAAPDGMAGATISLTGPKIPIPQIRPIALANQGGSWLLLHDSYTQVLQLLTSDDRRHYDPDIGAGPPLPPFAPIMPGRF